MLSLLGNLFKTVIVPFIAAACPKRTLLNRTKLVLCQTRADMDTDIGSPTWQLCGGKLAACRSASTDSKQIYLIIELQLKLSLDARFSQRD